MQNDTATARSEARRGWVRGPIRPFRFAQYRLLAGSLTLGLLAAGVWLVALVWQVIEIGGGPAQLSLVAAGPAVGIVLTSLAGGVLADRIPQRSILLVVFGARAALVAFAALLAVTGHVAFWHLALVGCAVGLANGFHYPAYSALLPSIVPPRDLLAANGIEGVLRPMCMQAAGPALAGAVVAVWSPGVALGLVAVLEAGAVLCLLALRPTPVRRDLTVESRHPLHAAVVDVAEGFRYMVRTPWLLTTLLFGSMTVLLLMGPIEVLIPFAIKQIPGGGPTDHAVVLAAFGVGGAVGSLAMASRRLPRRYLTVMILMWGVGCAPLAIVGVTGSIAVMAGAVFVVGALFSAPTVIWGTLLQRRVPPHLLGRVSSLDFFVSLVFMPVSMAIAGPVALAVGLAPAFLLAGTLPIVLAAAAIVAARMPRDELEHPLDVTVEQVPT
ncbi:MFS transporter [Rhodococcus chondri]|uniref:MFS transporter n=1 Tax=Rhodococcus chondri TaxID=3065941 RepID=A0ABU7JN56_9NOCA|nr:MFS transporter [Rhodococcus sp. CC-R104]MEE2031468.1 MFS transporter [Rhodococcus sp. CC-R104]